MRVRPRGGYGLDALWNDDFHHTAMVALTGRREAYYTDYTGSRAGARLGREVRLPLSGAVVRLAEAAPRHAGARSAAARVRHLPREPRPGRQLGRSAIGSHQLASPARLSRADGAAPARPGDADAVPGAGVRRPRRSCTSPIMRERCAKPVAKGRREFLSQFPSIARSATCSQRWRSRRRSRRSSAASSILGARAHMPSTYALHRDLLGAAAHRRRDRHVRSGARWRGPRARGVRAALLRRRAGIGCSSSTSAAISSSSAAAGAAARAAGRATTGALLWSSEAVRVRRPRHAADRSRCASGASPASARCCSLPEPDSDER